MDRLDATRYAGQVNAAAIDMGFKYAIPGTTLIDLNEVIEYYLFKHDCIPAFKGYRGYPATCCLSPNDTVVHGIPTNYVLKPGDILTIDVGCSHDGWLVDSARTRLIGTGIFPLQERLISHTESVLEAEISVIKDGVSLLEIAKIAEATAVELGVRIYPQWGGHKIGRELHEPPFIPNCIDPKLPKIKRWQLEREYNKYKLHAGEIICLEPVVTFGETDIITDDDGWTIRSKDRSIVAHTERCILITETGHEILS